MSGLQVGTCIFSFFLLIFTKKPSDVNIFLISDVEILKPTTFLNLFISRSINFFLKSFFPTILNLLASPPQIFKIKFVAIFNPSFIEFGSIPLSNLYLASVSKFSSFDVRLTEDGRN